jgi:hypothetical protein
MNFASSAAIALWSFRRACRLVPAAQTQVWQCEHWEFGIVMQECP